MGKLFRRKLLTVTFAFIMALSLPLCGVSSLLAAAEDNEIVHQEVGADADNGDDIEEPDEADGDEAATPPDIETESGEPAAPDEEGGNAVHAAMYSGEEAADGEEAATSGNTESDEEESEENESEEAEQEAEEPQIITIAAFAELAGEITYQGLDLPKDGEAPLTLGDISFPMSLEATDINGGEITVELDMWLGENYDLTVPGAYTFIAKRPQGYVLADGVAMPQIFVFVRSADLGIMPIAEGDGVERVDVNDYDELSDEISKELAAGATSKVITLKSGISISGAVNAGLDGGDKNITVLRGASDYMFTVDSGASLTLENITIDGDKNGPFTDEIDSLVYINGGEFIMKDGAVLKNNKASYGGGGVYIVGGGTLHMYGGEISGNTASVGGGVYASNGMLMMEGGEISSNTATGSGGGGVYVAFIGGPSNGSFWMSGGTISGNMSNGDGGGVSANGMFIMDGGIITGNTAIGNGGGVEFYNGAFALGNTAVIKNNLKGTVANNLYLKSGAYVTFLAPDSGMEVWVTTATESGVINDDTATDEDYEKYLNAEYLHADERNKQVVYDSDTKRIKIVDVLYTVTLTVNKDGEAFAEHGKLFCLIPQTGSGAIAGTGDDGTVTFENIPGDITYDLYEGIIGIGIIDTGVTITIDSDDATATLNYYTVQFASTSKGSASGASVTATYDGEPIASGTVVPGGKSLVLTASGTGASSYSYAWTVGGTSSGSTSSITIENLSKKVDASCAVTGASSSSSRSSSSRESSRTESGSSSESSSESSASEESSSTPETSASEADEEASVVTETAQTAETTSETSETGAETDSSSADEATSEAAAEAVAEAAAESVRESKSESESSRSDSRDSGSGDKSGSGRDTGDKPETAAEALNEMAEKVSEVITEMFSGARTPVGPAMDLTIGVDIGSEVYGKEIMLSAKGLKPFTEVKLTVYSEPRILGTQVADENGEATLRGTFPEDLEPGAHTVIADGIGTLDEPVQSVSMLQIDNRGIVTGMMEPSQVLEPIEAGDKSLVRAMEAGKPLYDPARHPGTVAGATLAICITGGGLAAMAGLRKPGKHSQNREERRSTDNEGAGDRGFLWRILPFREASDKFSIAIQEKMSRISFTLHRFVSDGVWSRAMLGSGGFLLWILGVGLGVYASSQVGFKALPPEFGIVLAIVALGFLDAGAGFAAWFTIAALALCTGHVKGIDDVSTLLGMFTLFAALMTLSGSRPLRREYKPGKKFIFDRVMDYLIPTVYLMLASSAILNVINGLSGLELFSEENCRTIKLVSVIALWVRLALEDTATYLFPRRYSQVFADAPVKQSLPLILGAIALYISLFVLVSMPFFGFGIMLMFLLALDVIPSLLMYADEHLPNSKFLHKWYPGAESTYASLVLTIIGIFLTLQLMTGVTDYRQISVAMVILAIPTAVAEIPSLFGREGAVYKNGWMRRITEVGCWALFAAIALDIIKLV